MCLIEIILNFPFLNHPQLVLKINGTPLKTIFMTSSLLLDSMSKHIKLQLAIQRYLFFFKLILTCFFPFG